jgi:heme o synthase
MITTKVESIKLNQSVWMQKAKLYFALLKFRLSFLVSFSAGFGFLLGTTGAIDWLKFFALGLGGFLITGSSVIINQILEKEFDRLMRRTQNRPLPADKLTVNECITFGFLVGLAGFTILLIFTNFFTAVLALFSLFLYGFIYTPLKRVGPIAVIVGAIPGALPPMLGWVAATGQISFEAFVIFTIQFVWQFPHFWAIAWVADEDYQRAGFKLLPSSEGKSLNSAIQIQLCTLFLIPVGLIPYQLGMTGWVSAMIVTLAGVLFLIPATQLLWKQDRKTALQIMFSSFIYLPVVQISFLMDKL